jgi:hypothetical protein
MEDSALSPKERFDRIQALRAAAAAAAPVTCNIEMEEHTLTDQQQVPEDQSGEVDAAQPAIIAEHKPADTDANTTGAQVQRAAEQTGLEHEDHKRQTDADSTAEVLQRKQRWRTGSLCKTSRTIELGDMKEEGQLVGFGMTLKGLPRVTSELKLPNEGFHQHHRLER